MKPVPTSPSAPHLEPHKLVVAALIGCTIAAAILYERPPIVDPTAQVLWLGDSLTEQGPSSRPGQNLGVGGLRCYDLVDVASGLAGSTAELVVLNCGANDLVQDHASPGLIATSVAEVLVTLSETVPDATVLLVGVLPAPRIRESQRREVNAMLASMGTGGVVFVLPPDSLDTWDGLHLSPAGYAALDAEIGPVVAALVGP